MTNPTKQTPIVSGYEVFHWEETQALLKRLGLQDAPIVDMQISMELEGPCLVTIAQQAEDHGADCEYPTLHEITSMQNRSYRTFQIPKPSKHSTSHPRQFIPREAGTYLSLDHGENELISRNYATIICEDPPTGLNQGDQVELVGYWLTGKQQKIAISDTHCIFAIDATDLQAIDSL